jgi:hypothetical protein
MQVFLTVAALLLSALPGMAEENALYVRKVENLPEGFFLAWTYPRCWRRKRPA